MCLPLSQNTELYSNHHSLYTGVVTLLFPRNVYHPDPSGYTTVNASVGREGPNRVHWPVSKKPVSTKSMFLTYMSVSCLTYVEKNGFVDKGLLLCTTTIITVSFTATNTTKY